MSRKKAPAKASEVPSKAAKEEATWSEADEEELLKEEKPSEPEAPIVAPSRGVTPGDLDMSRVPGKLRKLIQQ